jgi:ribosomal peptide maturation radical SAM protein 1
MPFASVRRPAIGVSLLKARLAGAGVKCRVGYPNLLFARQFGLETSELITDKVSPALFLGDWLFAQSAFSDVLDLDTYVATLRHHLIDDRAFAAVMRVRERIPEYLEMCFWEYQIREYDIIGFTTTFEQNLASLTFSRLIKQACPDKTIIMGGANCEGVMGVELARQFPWIDYVFSGESDDALPKLIRRLESIQGAPGEVPGVVSRCHGEPRLAAPCAPIHDLDRLPDPDYDDYFEELSRCEFGSSIEPALLIESARGCWWGAKSHCTFCGLNGATMSFRSKSAERVVDELERQQRRYGIHRFLAVDNILSYDYFKTFLPLLKERNLGVSLFYEIKSNLKRHQVELLRDAGVLAIQPGIESLNTHILRLMRKGVSAIQNVQLLKWCKEYGIIAAWNLLYGFPGETPDDYEEIGRVIEAIYHLTPPGVASVIRLDRFSPYFDHADRFGIENIRPFSMYSFVYPVPQSSLSNIAYFFEYEYADRRKPDEYVRPALEKLSMWRSNAGGDLVKQYGNDPELLLIDSRPGRDPRNFPLNGLQRTIYDFCDEARSRAAIFRLAREATGSDGQIEAPVQAFLDQLVNWQLMLREGNLYLSLAVEGVRHAAESRGVATFSVM